MKQSPTAEIISKQMRLFKVRQSWLLTDEIPFDCFQCFNVCCFAETPCTFLHYLIGEDEAKNPGDELEQEDHRQADTELRREERGLFTALSNESAVDSFFRWQIPRGPVPSTQTQLWLHPMLGEKRRRKHAAKLRRESFSLRKCSSSPYTDTP